MGGPSAEREVSLSSGRECATALRQAGYEVIEVDAGPDLPAQLRQHAPDVVFNALHGRRGEDGCVQGLLEWLGVPYTHSGVLASALAMDKEATKAASRAERLPVAESRLATKAEVMAAHVMPPPYVVKPYNEGSSVGVHIIREGSNEPLFEESGWPFGNMVMVEEYIVGREMTVSVMGERALGVTEITTSRGFYDYDAKYEEGGSTHVIPANIPDALTETLMDYAVKAHQALGCRGVSRADFRYDGENVYILEVNTQPGMTPTSLVPEQAAYAGMSFADLVTWMIENAECDP